jgi:Transposase DDE domain group 1
LRKGPIAEEVPCHRLRTAEKLETARLYRHSVEDLLRQRIYQICCGYEDVTDANALRFDAGLQTALRPS